VVRISALALLLALALPGCLFHRGDPLPAEPPRDFSLEVTVKGVEGWPWDGRLRFEAEGFADYDVTFKGTTPANRRGREAVEPAAVGRAWAAAAAAGGFDLPPVLRDGPEAPLLVEGRALRLDGRVRGDPASDPRLAALLEALRAAAPERVFRSPPTE